MMKLNFKTLFAGLAVSSVWLISEVPAVAFSFTTYFTGDSPKGDILLDAIEYDGLLRSDFSLVNQASIINNDLWTGGNTGAASADLGDNATVGLKQERVTNEGLVGALGNLSLNSIVDTEDHGSFTIDLFFDSTVDTVAFWERGMNSSLDAQALDASGNVLGHLVSLGFSSGWDDAGYSIDTQEIGSSQRVASKGLRLEDFGVSEAIAGVRVSSSSNYHGPDWKVVGLAAQSESVPEPTALAAMALLAGGVVLNRRRAQHRNNT